VLIRCGPHLQHLTLRHLTNTQFTRLLPFVPAVRHLNIIAVNLDSAAIGLIYQLLGGQLASLRVENSLQSCWDRDGGLIEPQAPGILTPLNRLLSAKGLEYLCIKERRPQFNTIAVRMELPEGLKYLEVGP